jgi:FKBP-type peptidyl-prolyl cis-trans isomerase
MVRRVPIGIRTKDLRLGSGDRATKGRIALIHYDCFLPRGEKVDSSRTRPHPVQFEIGQRDVVPGLEYGVVGMAVGGRNLPPNVALRYEIELLRITDEWDNSQGRDLAPEGTP